MSFKGQIEAQCPNGCEPFTTEVWSFIRGDQDESLRQAVLARECNLLLCESCGKAFFPEVSYVYYEPGREILAFVFPESHRAREAHWRHKMHDDFNSMKRALGSGLPLDYEPLIFFGHEGLAELLENEDYRGEESEVMEHYAKDLGLSLYRVSPRYAREAGVPGSLPYEGKTATPESVIQGIEKIVAANDRLTAYSGYLAVLKKSRALPPAASGPA